MWEDAWEELEGLPPEQRARPGVFRLRLQIFIGTERYESAAILAESMVANGDTAASTWLQGSWNIRRARSLREARAFLERAETILSGDALFQYNLACYCCVLGDMTASKERLTKCFELDKSYRLQALEDEDLVPFW